MKKDPMKPIEVEPGKTLKPEGGMAHSLVKEVRPEKAPALPRSELKEKGYLKTEKKEADPFTPYTREQLKKYGY